MPGHYDQLYWNGLSQENTLLSCFQVKMNLAHVLQLHHQRVALTKNLLAHACALTNTYSVSSSISVHIVPLSSVTPAVNYQTRVLALLRPPTTKPLTRVEWQEFNGANNNPQIKQNTDRCLRLCLPVHGLCYTHTLLSFVLKVWNYSSTLSHFLTGISFVARVRNVIRVNIAMTTIIEHVGYKLDKRIISPSSINE